MVNWVAFASGAIFSGEKSMRWFSTSLFVAGAILAGISTSAIANDSMSLDTLKAKYAVGNANIDRSAYVAYSNAICNLMPQFKRSGALDTFLVLQNEMND